ncbi:MAG: hypothetical protein IJN03_01180 [Bacilli bacterium]|nr:hypothetical protein [Bacilli bacterium]
MGDKKSTVLLTVVAVATLLVAVAGSTFAFFAANTDELEGSVEVSTQTAAGSDVFTSTGASQIGLSVTNDKMMPGDANTSETEATITETDADAAAGEKLVVSLEAGSGKATCTYKLKYVDAPASTETNPETIVYAPSSAYAKITATDKKEYTLEGTDGTNSFVETNMHEVAEFLADDANTFTITDTYEAASVATTQTWTFTARFYNLPNSQDELINKRFAGTVTVDKDSIVCENEAA